MNDLPLSSSARVVNDVADIFRESNEYKEKSSDAVVIRVDGVTRCLWTAATNSEKTYPSVTLSATNFTWTDPGANPGLCAERPETIRLSHGTTCKELCWYELLKERIDLPVSSFLQLTPKVHETHCEPYQLYTTVRYTTLHYTMNGIVIYSCCMKLFSHHLIF
jgi:hypothetical protein